MAEQLSIRLNWEAPDSFYDNLESRLPHHRLHTGDWLYLIARFKNPPQPELPVCVFPGVIDPSPIPYDPSVIGFSTTHGILPSVDVKFCMNSLRFIMPRQKPELVLPVYDKIYTVDMAYLSDHRHDWERSAIENLPEFNA